MTQLSPAAALLRYESLKFEEKIIKKELDELKPIVINAVPEDKELELEHGTIVRSPGRIQWKYSAALQAKIDEIEDMKKLEQQDGAAKAIYGEPFVTYRERKEQ